MGPDRAGRFRGTGERGTAPRRGVDGDAPPGEEAPPGAPGCDLPRRRPIGGRAVAGNHGTDRLRGGPARPARRPDPVRRRPGVRRDPGASQRPRGAGCRPAHSGTAPRGRADRGRANARARLGSIPTGHRSSRWRRRRASSSSVSRSARPWSWIDSMAWPRASALRDIVPSGSDPSTRAGSSGWRRFGPATAGTGRSSSAPVPSRLPRATRCAARADTNPLISRPTSPSEPGIGKSGTPSAGPRPILPNRPGRPGSSRGWRMPRPSAESRWSTGSSAASPFTASRARMAGPGTVGSREGRPTGLSLRPIWTSSGTRPRPPRTTDQEDICLDLDPAAGSPEARWRADLERSEAALKAGQGDLAVHRARAESLLRLGRYREVVAAAASWIGASPESASAYYYRALARARLGDAEGARADVKLVSRRLQIRAAAARPRPSTRSSRSFRASLRRASPSSRPRSLSTRPMANAFISTPGPTPLRGRRRERGRRPGAAPTGPSLSSRTP